MLIVDNNKDMKNIFWDEYYEMVTGRGFVVIFIVLTLTIFTTGILLARKSCLVAYSEYVPSWSFIGGCRVMWNDKLTPIQMVINVDVK